jgi:broad specificity polyphosphatase/5'/3'-nucleotidase SurE
VNIYDVSVKQLKRAAAIKEQIERLNRELSVIVNAPESSRSALKSKRTMSASVRKKIAAAQKHDGRTFAEQN